jgi:hypothetical protein
MTAGHRTPTCVIRLPPHNVNPYRLLRRFRQSETRRRRRMKAHTGNWFEKHSFGGDYLIAPAIIIPPGIRIDTAGALVRRYLT